MSNILLITRRASSSLADKMMHTSASSSLRPALISSLDKLSIQNKHEISRLNNNSQMSCFSSMARKRQIVELPPNLKFDPRATSSPFYGADEVSRRTKPLQQTSEDGEQQVAATTEVLDTVDNVENNQNDEDYDELEEDADEEERILYDLSTKEDIPRAIPLPQRLHVPIIDFQSGDEVGTFHLSPQTFGCTPVRVDILQRVVVWQRNKKRGKRNAGARTKTISEVSGSGRKVRNQKGGGVARAGHSRPAHWRGGAKAHGPKGNIQDYTTKLNKKVRRMGMRHALSQKLLEGNLVIVNDMAANTHKTKVFDDMLDRFDVSGRYGTTALMVDDAKADEGSEEEAFIYGGVNVNLKVASGNLPKVKVMNQIACNVYDMLKYKKLFLSLDAVRALEERLEK